MKRIHQLLVLACISAVVIAGFSWATAIAVHRQPLELAQAASSSGQRILEVALQESATARLTSGESYTGGLTAFDSSNLTLSSGNFSQPVPLAQLREVEFFGDVWILTPEGWQRSPVIRGLAIPLEGVSVDAFELSSPGKSANLDLTDVLDDEEFARLLRDPNKIHTVTEITFTASEQMDVTVKSVLRR
ncbi:MAG: hypothetical protein VKL39_15370 [Leptolyngbyaceae bacterium]|nr:hypothetical protein [Leptolyngbyaceae bacterium]